MTNSNRTASAVSLSKLHITLLRKLFEAVKQEMGQRAIESPDKS